MKYLKIFLFTILISVFFAGAAQAQVNYGQGSPKDSDYDGLTDQGESQLYKTDPQKFDTDGDGISDGAEILYGSDPLIKGYQIDLETEEEAIPWAWYVIRATGLAAYVLLFIIIISGIGIYTKSIFKFFKSETVLILHKLFSYSAGIFIIAHIAALPFDEFLGFSFADILIPFVSDFKTGPLGLGILGFYLFLIVILSSIFLREKFRRLWRLLHYLSYPTFILIFMHGIRAGTDTEAVQGMYWATGIIFGVLFLYRIAFPYTEKQYAAIIKRMERPTADLMIIDFSLGGEKLKFKPGQYVSLALYDKKGRPGQKHHFSISSSPNDNEIRLGIKILGNFTQELSKMKEGDQVVLYGPYGDFVFDSQKMKDAVFIAGGIGVTPFMSAFRYATDNRLSNKLTLLYSNRNLNGIAFLDEIRELAKKNENFKPHFTVTDEAAPRGFEHGMLCQATIQKFIDNISGKYFFICGPAPFMDAMVDCLLACGVPQNRIRREYFY